MQPVFVSRVMLSWLYLRRIQMAHIKYRGAKNVPVSVVKKVKRNGKIMVEVKTKKALPHRRKGSIDYRSPDKVYK